MNRAKQKLMALSFAAGVFVIALIVACVKRSDEAPRDGSVETEGKKKKLYWFIPDGMRCDPDLFNIYRWAEEGKLPNIKKMMERGSYGFCRPTFPSHTPTNFATLFTGAYPEVHGVNDGPMHTEGSPLSRVSVGGFSSVAKKVTPMWLTLEKEAEAKVALMSVPGSTPPELQNGITIRGRWGGWGADFHAINFQARRDLAMRKQQGRGARLFFFGPELTQYVEKSTAEGWADLPLSHSEPLETILSAWGASIHAVLTDSTDDDETNYDEVSFAALKNGGFLTKLKESEWSEWLPITLKWRIPAKKLERDIETFFKIKIIKLEDDGFFRVRFFFNNINKFLTEPDYVAGDLIEGVGPMVDFVDNFPPQLIFFPEDKGTFLEEADMSLTWHRDAVSFVIDKYQPDVFVSDVYTPNQMLTSRWWMGYIDPASSRYGDASQAERDKLWSEVHWLYKKLDDIVGKMLEKADEDTYVVLSSDHGAVPLDHWVRLNNLFAKEGLLKFELHPETGEPTIDWAQTQAVYLKMHSVYLNPNGLGGDWTRASGPEYEQLRERVKKLLLELEDGRGVKPIVKITGWEEATSEFRLTPERSGDLIIANRPGYGWSEELTGDLAIFTTPLKTGYKQAILTEEVKGMWTPFVIVGPGIRKGNNLGVKPINMVDQYPTLMQLLGRESGDWVQGRVLEEVIE